MDRLAFLCELSAQLDQALSRFEAVGDRDRRRFEFARGLNLRAWERDAVKRLVDESYLTGEIRKLRPPIYDTRYARHSEDFHGAMTRAQQRAERIHERFVMPKVEARRRFLADYVAGWNRE